MRTEILAEKKIKILQVCPKCEGEIAQGPASLLRHCLNKPDHAEILAGVQATMQKKHQLASLKQELAAERTSAKRARVQVPCKSSEHSDTALAKTAELDVIHPNTDTRGLNTSDPAMEGTMIDEGEDGMPLVETIACAVKKALESIPGANVVVITM